MRAPWLTTPARLAAAASVVLPAGAGAIGALAGRAPAGARATAPIALRLDVNSADAPLLELLPGVGPALAARLVADREAHGAFPGPEDLERVPGIGPRIAARMAPDVVFSAPAPGP